jgi:hypothetical protein
LYPDIIPLLRAQARREIGRKRKAAKPRHWQELTTAHALGLGAAVPMPSIEGGSLTTGLLYIEGAQRPQTPSVADDEVGILEQHPALDVRVLSRRWKEALSGRWAHTLEWPDDRGIAEMVVAVELEDPEGPHSLVITRLRGGAKTIQKIGLCPMPAEAGGTRWFFLCGPTGRRCEVLSLRNKFFASPKAQRLVHQSQRSLSQSP